MKRLLLLLSCFSCLLGVSLPAQTPAAVEKSFQASPENARLLAANRLIVELCNIVQAKYKVDMTLMEYTRPLSVEQILAEGAVIEGYKVKGRLDEYARKIADDKRHTLVQAEKNLKQFNETHPNYHQQAVRQAEIDAQSKREAVVLAPPVVTKPLPTLPVIPEWSGDYERRANDLIMSAALYAPPQGDQAFLSRCMEYQTLVEQVFPQARSTAGTIMGADQTHEFDQMPKYMQCDPRVVALAGYRSAAKYDWIIGATQHENFNKICGLAAMLDTTIIESRMPPKPQALSEAALLRIERTHSKLQSYQAALVQTFQAQEAAQRRYRIAEERRAAQEKYQEQEQAIANGQAALHRLEYMQAQTNADNARRAAQSYAAQQAAANKEAKDAEAFRRLNELNSQAETQRIADELHRLNFEKSIPKFR